MWQPMRSSTQEKQQSDDSGILSVGETLPGNLDHPRDMDFYSIWLSEGDVIEAIVDTVNFDAFGMITFAGARDDEIDVRLDHIVRNVGSEDLFF